MTICPMYDNCPFLEYLERLELNHVSKGFQNLYCKSGRNNCDRLKNIGLEQTTPDIMPNRLKFPNKKTMLRGEELHAIKKDLIEWKKAYFTQNKIVDKYHLRLIILINLIETQYKVGRPQGHLKKLAFRLKKLNEKHQSEEKTIIKRSSDKNNGDYMNRLKASYDAFHEFYNNEFKVDDHFTDFLREWILKHIKVHNASSQ